MRWSVRHGMLGCITGALVGPVLAFLVGGGLVAILELIGTGSVGWAVVFGLGCAVFGFPIGMGVGSIIGILHTNFPNQWQRLFIGGSIGCLLGVSLGLAFYFPEGQRSLVKEFFWAFIVTLTGGFNALIISQLFTPTTRSG